MSVSDFLFEGKPPKSVTEYGSTVDSIPKWLSDYNQGVISKANAIAAQPYQNYSGTRVAGFTPDQTKSFEDIRSGQGNYQPFFDKASGNLDQAIAADPMAQADPYFNQSMSQYQKGQGMVDQATGSYVDNVNKYMSPYVQNVLDRQTTLANRNLNESFIPGLQAAFVGSGQFGSGKMMQQGLQGIRDIQEDLSEQQLATLDNAYKTGADIYSTDQNRVLDAGKATSDIGTNIGNIGTSKADIINTDAQTNMEGALQQSQLGEATQTAGLKDAAALESIGKSQQDLSQKSMDLAYEDFLQQRDFDKGQLNWMNDLVKGMPTDNVQTTSQTAYPPVYQPSGLSQIAATAGTIAGIGDLLKNRGGRIKRAVGGLARARRGV